ncbi:peptidoglycan DD-metalloendopeptidase family protein [Nostoc sp.]|uniref:peptidoglycan DD-metalloendopeptidase family protein n=1 Tax=Nostoc sp. TaxID=1180 RepID=UPI002FFBF2FB
MSTTGNKILSLGFATISLIGLFLPGIAQAVETFSVNGNMALNTNNYFHRIDGTPRMSIYQRNDNDPDQQFDRLSGNRGGILLRHRSTGQCLNAHYLENGREINVWNCDSNDPDENWNLIDVGGGFNLIKRANTNLCVDTPTRDNQGKVHLWTCDSNNPNQRWQSSAGQGQGSTSSSNGQVDMQGLQRLIFGNVSSTVTSPYGYQRCDIWGGTYANCQHPALDIAGPVNTPLYSPIEGVVIARNDNYGIIGIYNQKSNITFFFGHMNRTDVNVNQQITKGQQVGLEGTKGHVTGAHVHFEARPGKQTYMATAMNQTINPLDAVNQANR